MHKKLYLGDHCAAKASTSVYMVDNLSSTCYQTFYRLTSYRIIYYEIPSDETLSYVIIFLGTTCGIIRRKTTKLQGLYNDIFVFFFFNVAVLRNSCV